VGAGGVGVRLVCVGLVCGGVRLVVWLCGCEAVWGEAWGGWG
jgi:hypothetical protein